MVASNIISCVYYKCTDFCCEPRGSWYHQHWSWPSATQSQPVSNSSYLQWSCAHDVPVEREYLVHTSLGERKTEEQGWTQKPTSTPTSSMSSLQLRTQNRPPPVRGRGQQLNTRPIWLSYSLRLVGSTYRPLMRHQLRGQGNQQTLLRTERPAACQSSLHRWRQIERRRIPPT